jgi:hypothetical protein
MSAFVQLRSSLRRRHRSTVIFESSAIVSLSERFSQKRRCNCWKRNSCKKQSFGYSSSKRISESIMTLPDGPFRSVIVIGGNGVANLGGSLLCAQNRRTLYAWRKSASVDAARPASKVSTIDRLELRLLSSFRARTVCAARKRRNLFQRQLLTTKFIAGWTTKCRVEHVLDMCMLWPAL